MHTCAHTQHMSEDMPSTTCSWAAKHPVMRIPLSLTQEWLPLQTKVWQKQKLQSEPALCLYPESEIRVEGMAFQLLVRAQPVEHADLRKCEAG